MKLDNFHWLYIDKPQWVKTWIDRTSQMTDKPKHKMTRAEAVTLFADRMAIPKESSEKVIDFYIEAGMLEIVEEKPARSYVPIGFEFPFSKYDSWAECCKALADQGYVIVELSKA
jgi:hypothetical protein